MKLKKSLGIIMLVGLLALTGCSQTAEQKPEATTEQPATEQPVTAAEIKTMTGEELAAKNSTKEKDTYLLIDVRKPDEYAAGHIAHAVSLPLENVEEALPFLERFKETPIVLYCNTGNRSGQAAEILVNNGFSDVTNAQGVKEFEYPMVQYTDILGSQLEEVIGNDKVIIVDSRPAKDFEGGHIDGAINIPFDQTKDHLDLLPNKDQEIIVYCNTGTKSAEQAQELYELGYTDINNSVEGVKEYPFELVK